MRGASQGLKRKRERKPPSASTPYFGACLRLTISYKQAERRTTWSEAVDKNPRPKRLLLDYQTDQIPRHVQEIIETHLAIEAEEARRAGALGFMARAFTI